MRIGHGGPNRVLARMLMLGTGALIAATLAPRSAAAADQEKVLYSFCTQSGCTDGSGPSAGLIMDASGHLYGTTMGGGGHCQSTSPLTCGTVFELIPNAAKTAWTHKVLYRFCAKANCIDGAQPLANLIMDASGHLYGTTYVGGAHAGANGVREGTLFELIPNAAKTAWAEKVLYSFCAQGVPACSDGANPEAGLIIDAAGNLYGTTHFGGGTNDSDNGGWGTVFELTPNAKAAWTHKVLYRFCAQGGINCTDGAFPDADLIMDAAGNLYGTTTYGGTASYGGTIFELTPNAAKTAWTHKVLYSFCAQGGYPVCTDGAYPSQIMAVSGKLYGTTGGGGKNAQCFGGYGCGTVFELTPNAAKIAWAHKVLYSFCAQGGINCTDGYAPTAGLIEDAAANLYGTTGYGGAHGRGTTGGTVFELIHNAPKTAWTERVLYSFCAQGATCADGEGPTAGLIDDAAGNLYGMTESGGAHEGGTVFELP